MEHDAKAAYELQLNPPNMRRPRNDTRRSELDVRDAVRARSVALHRRSYQGPPKEKLTKGDRVMAKPTVHPADRIERSKKASAGSKQRSVHG